MRSVTSANGGQTRTSSVGPHVRFRRVQTLVREGSPLVKLRNSAVVVMVVTPLWFSTVDGCGYRRANLARACG